MSRLVYGILRLILALLAAILLFFQVLAIIIMSQPWGFESPEAYKFLIFTVLILGAICVQVVLASVWHLLTMAYHDTVFSPRAFRSVDVVIGAAATAAVLATLLTFVLGYLGRSTGEIPPGAVLIVLILALVAVGVGLIVYVLRLLLAQAVSRDAEANQLAAELDGVI
ncbi:DUF2975 domain-containing protein [Actinomyces sp. F1_1611]